MWASADSTAVTGMLEPHNKVYHILTSENSLIYSQSGGMDFEDADVCRHFVANCSDRQNTGYQYFQEKQTQQVQC